MGARSGCYGQARNTPIRWARFRWSVVRLGGSLPHCRKRCRKIIGHYRSYQIPAKLSPGSDSQDPMTRALSESMHQELERILRLLGLLYPHLDEPSAYLGLQAKGVTVYDNALEFLDSVLKSQCEPCRCH
jgi:hypothetical protein